MSELGHRTINVCKNGSEPEKCESLERCSHSIDGGWVPKAMLELATNLEWQHLSGFPIIPASRSVTPCLHLLLSLGVCCAISLGGLSLPNPSEETVLTYQGHT